MDNARISSLKNAIMIAKKKNYKYVVCIMDIGIKIYHATNNPSEGIIMWRKEYDK